MNRFSSKAIYALPPDLFQGESVELAAMFVLGERRETDRVILRQTTGTRAFRALAENTFNTTYRQPDRLAQHLRSVSTISTSLPVIATSFPRDYTSLPTVVEALIHRALD